MKRISWSWILGLTLLAIIVVSVGAIYVILKFYKPQKDTVEFEIFKSLLQIITVLILGQIISLVVALFNYNRQKAEARREFQKYIVQRLIRVYVATKSQRRLLRAKGLDPPYIGSIQPNTYVAFDVFDKQMQLINETELKLETIRHEVEASPDIFTNFKELTGYLKGMEDYLRELIKLYEQKHATFSGKGSRVELDKLSLPTISLRDFVGEAEDSRFVKEFASLYDKASDAITKSILK